MTRPTITAELLAWLESKAPYSTAEGDRRHAEIAALVRALEVVRVAADKAVLRLEADLAEVADTLEKDGRFPNTVPAIRAALNPTADGSDKVMGETT